MQVLHQAGIDKGTCCARLRFDVGQAKADVLVVDQRVSERLALLDVVHRPLQRLLQRHSAAHGDQQALADQAVHGVAKACVELADDHVSWHKDVVHEQFGRVLGELADLVQHPPAREPGAFGVHPEQADAPCACVWLGLGENDHAVGVVAVGDEGLLTGQLEAALHGLGRGADGLQVAARAWLGHA